MKMKEQKRKVSLVRNVINKCKYSMQGLAYCFENESSFLLEAICACLIIILGIWFDISFIEWTIALGSIVFISITELLNTAIEAVCDLITEDYNENIKVAKDCGSAATGLMSVLATVANLIIFTPYIIKFILSVM